MLVYSCAVHGESRLAKQVLYWFDNEMRNWGRPYTTWRDAVWKDIIYHTVDVEVWSVSITLSFVPG